MERWKTIEGFDGKYLVSDLGRVKSHVYGKERILKQSIRRRYFCVGLWNGKKVIKFQVHRLVAVYFVDNLENKEQVNHKNGDIHCNDARNLEWVTGLENLQHAVSIGRIQPIKRIKCKDTGEIFDTSYRAAHWVNEGFGMIKKNSVIADKIRTVCRGQRKTAYGYRWEYAD